MSFPPSVVGDRLDLRFGSSDPLVMQKAADAAAPRPTSPAPFRLPSPGTGRWLVSGQRPPSRSSNYDLAPFRSPKLVVLRMDQNRGKAIYVGDVGGALKRDGNRSRTREWRHINIILAMTALPRDGREGLVAKFNDANEYRILGHGIASCSQRIYRRRSYCHLDGLNAPRLCFAPVVRLGRGFLTSL